MKENSTYPRAAESTAPQCQESRAESLRDKFGLLSESDLGELLAVDPRTLAIWRCQKRGPDAVKLGRAVFYRRSDIDAWVALNVTPMDRDMASVA